MNNTNKTITPTKPSTTSTTTPNTSCSSSSSSASSTSSKSSKSSLNHHVNGNIEDSPPAAPAPSGSAAAGGNRAVRFYDDYIDFRGDMLHRPPNSKACRILWEYLYLLLQDTNYSSVIKWEDESQMVFRIVQAEKLAALWGLQKNRLGMTYEKLSRGMRYYYPNNIIAREPGRRLLYRLVSSHHFYVLIQYSYNIIIWYYFLDLCVIQTRSKSSSRKTVHIC